MKVDVDARTAQRLLTDEPNLFDVLFVTKGTGYSSVMITAKCKNSLSVSLQTW